MAFVMMETTFPLLLKDTFGYGPGRVGAFFALAGLIIVLVQGGLIHRLTKRVGEWPLAIAGPVLVAIAMCWMGGVVWRAAVWFIFIGTIFNATGRSLQTPTLSALISKFADPTQQGTVFGLFHMLSSLARVIGPAIATAHIMYTAHHASPFFLAGAITALVAMWTVALHGALRDAPMREPSPQAAAEVI
jgi:sugar phosphate permease